MHRWILAASVALVAGTSQAALITNMAQPITHTVTVQPIIVSNDDGSNTAEFFGSASQQAEIEAFIDQIWAQAGIDVTFLAANTYNNTFANIGTIGNNNPRPTSDLPQIVANGDNTMGVGNSDASVIDMYFVEIAAGFSNVSENTANGLAFVGGNGITQHVGDNLVGFTAGREVIASVVAHEIGHNLGLPHIVEAENLMQAGGSPNQGERLNGAQIAVALASSLSVVTAVPEPSSFAALTLFCVGVISLQRRKVR